MNYIDLFLGILLVIAAIQGFRQGFIIELASLAALVLGIWGGIKFSDWTAKLITDTTGFHSKYLSVIAFIVTFVVIVVAIHILANVLDKTVKVAALGFLNRLAGIIFGVLKTAVILSILLILFDAVDENVQILPATQKAESKIYKPMKNLVPTIFPFIKLWDPKTGTSRTRKKRRPNLQQKPCKQWTVFQSAMFLRIFRCGAFLPAFNRRLATKHRSDQLKNPAQDVIQVLF